MEKYIRCKIIQAEPMDEMEWLLFNPGRNMSATMGPDGRARPGYRVVYPDGYVSWSPKDVFENAYRRITDAELDLIHQPTMRG